jgi:hypothetical protein
MIPYSLFLLKQKKQNKKNGWILLEVDCSLIPLLSRASDAHTSREKTQLNKKEETEYAAAALFK